MTGRFRIRPEHLGDVLQMFARIGVEPLSVSNRDDGAMAVEIGELSEAQGQALAASFQPHWSAIVAIAGGNPFETKQ